MTGVGLLDRDDVEHACAAWLVHPDALHTGQARALDLVPDHSRLHDALRIRKVRGRHHRAREPEDRIVAMVDALDAYDRLLRATAGVVAGELAERTFGHGLAGMHRAFQHDFGVRRHRQAVELALDDVIRRAAMARGVVVFRKAEADLVAACEKEQRIVAAGDEYRARLPLLPIFLADLTAVLARRDPQAHLVGPLHHRSIGAAVDP